MANRNRVFAVLKRQMTLALVLAAGFSAQAQTLSRKDTDEIRVLAREKIKGLNDLLNAVSNEDLSNYERRYLMMNSYMPSNDQIFFNDGVIIEDDVDTRHIASAPGLDTPIEKYLSNFDLFYVKSEINTIEFTNTVVSDVKMDKYPFVKVFYTEHFKGKSSKNQLTYQPVPRVAELRAVKSGNDWVVYLTRIAFNSTENAKAAPVSPKPSSTYDSLQKKKDPIVVKATDKKPVTQEKKPIVQEKKTVAQTEDAKAGERVFQDLKKTNQAEIDRARKMGFIKVGAGVAALAFGAVTYSMLNKDYKDYKNRISNHEGLTSYAKPGIYISVGAAAVGIGVSLTSLADFGKAKR